MRGVAEPLHDEFAAKHSKPLPKTFKFTRILILTLNKHQLIQEGISNLQFMSIYLINIPQRYQYSETSVN